MENWPRSVGYAHTGQAVDRSRCTALKESRKLWVSEMGHSGSGFLSVGRRAMKSWGEGKLWRFVVIAAGIVLWNLEFGGEAEEPWAGGRVWSSGDGAACEAPGWDRLWTPVVSWKWGDETLGTLGWLERMHPATPLWAQSCALSGENQAESDLYHFHVKIFFFPLVCPLMGHPWQGPATITSSTWESQGPEDLGPEYAWGTVVA